MAASRGRTLPVLLPTSSPRQPATAFPIGLSKGGLPLALQAIGPYLEDRTPLGFTALLAKEIGGFVPPPGYA
jgi:amidase